MASSEIEVMFQQGRIALRSRRVDDAVTLFVQVLESEPQHAECRENLASVLFAQGEYLSAAEHFSALSTQYPGQARYLINLGAVYNRLGDYKKAEEFLRKALQRDRRSADAYYNLGLAYRRSDQQNLAISAYREAVRLDPKMAEAYYNLGNIYAEMNNHTLAIMNYKKALDVRPDFEKARTCLQRSERMQEELKQANNPFGRTPPPVATVPVRNVTMRALSELEREEDRKKVRQLAEQIERLGQEAAEYLREGLEPRLLALQKMVAGGLAGDIALIRAGADFREALEQWSMRRRALRRKVLELRAHEELLLAPDVSI